MESMGADVGGEGDGEGAAEGEGEGVPDGELGEDALINFQVAVLLLDVSRNASSAEQKGVRRTLPQFFLT